MNIIFSTKNGIQYTSSRTSITSFLSVVNCWGLILPWWYPMTFIGTTWFWSGYSKRNSISNTFPRSIQVSNGENLLIQKNVKTLLPKLMKNWKIFSSNLSTFPIKLNLNSPKYVKSISILRIPSTTVAIKLKMTNISGNASPIPLSLSLKPWRKKHKKTRKAICLQFSFFFRMTLTFSMKKSSRR